MEEWRPQVAAALASEPRAGDWDYKHPKSHSRIAMNDFIAPFPKFLNQCEELSVVLMPVVFVLLPTF